VADGFEVKDNGGVQRTLARIGRIRACGPLRVLLSAIASTGKVYRTQQAGWVTDARTAAQNIIAIRTNAKRGRNVYAMTLKERDEANAIIAAATREVVEGMATSLEAGAVLLGAWIVKTVIRHIRMGASTERFRPVTEGTRKQKERETRRMDLPPMWRTGQLQQALVTQVRKL
jgi:hypothetical protein